MIQAGIIFNIEMDDVKQKYAVNDPQQAMTKKTVEIQRKMKCKNSFLALLSGTIRNDCAIYQRNTLIDSVATI